MLLKDSPGHVEANSGIPVAKPLNLRVPTQSERILSYIRLEQMRAMQDAELETFEEADDFEFEDGEEWVSPYEEVFEPVPDPFVAAPAATVTPPSEPSGDQAHEPTPTP